MSDRALSDTEELIVVDRYTSGATAREIVFAMNLSCSSDTVLNILKRRGVSRRRSGMRKRIGPCSFAGCPNVQNNRLRRGLCLAHYRQFIITGNVVPLRHTPRALIPNPQDPTTVLIPLTRGFIAVVDEADGFAVGQFKWWTSEHKKRHVVYAKARIGHLHQFLWKLWGNPPTDEVDHVDGNGLNCRRINLRAATRQQNACNLRLAKSNRSGIRGVRWDPRTRMWAADIGVNGKTIWLGRHGTKEEATEVRAQAERKYHGEFASTPANDVREPPERPAALLTEVLRLMREKESSA